jgi:hypothetical protein
MCGQLVTRAGEYDPSLHAPPKYCRACKHEAFTPEPFAGVNFSILGSPALFQIGRAPSRV